MSISSPASGDNCMEVTVQNTTYSSSGAMILTAIKYLTIGPVVNYNNNLPFVTDYYQNIELGVNGPPTQGSPAAVLPARLLVQGATADHTSNALWVTNDNGTASGDTLLFVRDDGAVAINSQTPSSSCGSAFCTLTVNGSIATSEVIVTSGISADYVFKPGYQLAPLEDVASYIQKEHHLPGIPSEADVKAKGVNLGEMQAKLLAKIEELTLHLIKEEEKNHQLEERNREIEERVAHLERRDRQITK